MRFIGARHLHVHLDVLKAGLVVLDHFTHGVAAGNDVVGVLADIAGDGVQAVGRVGVLAAAVVKIVVRAHRHAAGGHARGDRADGLVAGVAQRAGEHAGQGADGAGLIAGLAEEFRVGAFGQARIHRAAILAQHRALGAGATGDQRHGNHESAQGCPAPRLLLILHDGSSFPKIYLLLTALHVPSQGSMSIFDVFK
ncbi:hypothetical protein D3C71_1414050 [compost metagenome]